MQEMFIGKLFKVPVFLHWTLILMFLVFFMGDKNQFLISSFVFCIILFHEFGHCFGAKYFGLEIDKIVLTPLGGGAYIHLSRNPFEELVISLSGPLVNVLLIPILYFLKITYPYIGIINELFYINLLILIFNMIPAHPLDGGSALLSLIEMTGKKRLASLEIVTRVSYFFCVLIFIYGIYTKSFMLPILAFYIGWLAYQQLNHERQRNSFFYDWEPKSASKRKRIPGG